MELFSNFFITKDEECVKFCFLFMGKEWKSCSFWKFFVSFILLEMGFINNFWIMPFLCLCTHNIWWILFVSWYLYFALLVYFLQLIFYVFYCCSSERINGKIYGNANNLNDVNGNNDANDVNFNKFNVNGAMLMLNQMQSLIMLILKMRILILLMLKIRTLIMLLLIMRVLIMLILIMIILIILMLVVLILIIR